MRFPTKIPTIVGLFLVMVVIAGMIFISERFLRAPSAASGSTKPENVQMTNITDTGFTVTWTSQLAATGGIEVIPATGKKTVVFDERDMSNKKLGKYITH